MKRGYFLAVLFCFTGCDTATQIESNSLVAPNRVETSATDAEVNNSEFRIDATEQPVFLLSDSATKKLRATMASIPDRTHLAVSVDFDDEKFCVGFHYNLHFEDAPSTSRFALIESNGIKLAIEKDDIKFLDGTTLDYATLASGDQGFVFRNPNENVSLPDELREAE